jgi:hypothetical protein
MLLSRYQMLLKTLQKLETDSVRPSKITLSGLRGAFQKRKTSDRPSTSSDPPSWHQVRLVSSLVLLPIP